jgi:hypothetical protein
VLEAAKALASLQSKNTADNINGQHSLPLPKHLFIAVCAGFKASDLAITVVCNICV